MERVPFETVFNDRTGGNKKLKQSEYLFEGLLPIIDQGQKKIAGYTDDLSFTADVKLPCVIFGDHTQIFKYIDFAFALGADGVKVLEPSEKVNALYAYYFFNQVKLSGKVGYNRNYKYLKEISIPLLDLKTQQKIATTLDQADKARQKRKLANQLTEQFLQSAYLEMFGDPVRNEKGWEVKNFGEVCDDLRYGTSIHCSSIQNKDDYPVLRIPNVVAGYINDLDMKFAKPPKDEIEKLKLKSGDILFVRTNGNPEYIGRCAVFTDDGEFLYASYLIRARLRDFKTVLPVFLKCLFLFPSYRNEMLKKAKTTAGNFNINTEGLRSLKVFLPPLTEQKKFASLVAQTEKLRSKQRESERELENLFQSLMQRYFG